MSPPPPPPPPPQCEDECLTPIHCSLRGCVAPAGDALDEREASLEEKKRAQRLRTLYLFRYDSIHDILDQGSAYAVVIDWLPGDSLPMIPFSNTHSPVSDDIGVWKTVMFERRLLANYISHPHPVVLRKDAIIADKKVVVSPWTGYPGCML